MIDFCFVIVIYCLQNKYSALLETTMDICKQTVATLRSIAKKEGLKGYSQMKKAQLCAALTQSQGCGIVDLKSQKCAEVILKNICTKFPDLDLCIASVRPGPLDRAGAVIVNDNKVVGIVDKKGEIRKVPSPPPPPPLGTVPRIIASSPAAKKIILKKVSQSPKVSASGRNVLMDQIKKGRTLKKVVRQETKKPQKTAMQLALEKKFASVRHQNNDDDEW
jgi:hypothetical protein